MQVIAWAPELATGMIELDDLHRAMIDAMQKVIQIDDALFEPAFRDFVASVESDFRGEETAMEMVDYPGARAHCEQHARTLAALHHTLSQVMRGDVAIGKHTLGLLFQWFTVHIATMDRKLALACVVPGSRRDN